ncbi:MAG: spore coat protein [Dehalococcoidia bacterium]|nr:spore coat protein [Dehalococcoidia bacterium]
MIDGLDIKPLVRHADDRGYLAEMLRADDPIYRGFGQANVTMTYPGVVKAWHYHNEQDDLWVCVKGMIRAAMYDMREASPTFGQVQEVYMGDHNPVLVRIPIGVAHGYKVVGNDPAIIIYFVTTPYDRSHPDEFRIPWDSPDIPFDWSLRNR